ncbi:leucine rich repeat containing 75Bb [Gadus macrocephalus]|uniref:leucine rich repeat containing 75Bb n=1 Tax=Gadus macrocephalus TaxID=80720 RepID=UPI0028CB3B51|nr:leucine rich repeat containing 75Bb [Gadus macrocephalus]
MGSKLTRPSSLDIDGQLSKRRRPRTEGCGDSGRSAGGGGAGFAFPYLTLRSDKLPGLLRKTNHSPYVRRVAWIREMQTLLGDKKTEQAAEVLTLLRKDLGLQATSLNHILYKNAAFLHLADPISHELLLHLARDMHCPKREGQSLKSTNKMCRQLMFHLTPHSKWTRQSVPRRKPQACLKTTLDKKPSGDVVNLSGTPLSGRDLRRLARHLQGAGAAGGAGEGTVSAVDLSFTELRDEGLRLLLPGLAGLPGLTTLAVNGNRLTAAVLKDLSEALKDAGRFPSLAWVDLGNNVDICTVPQPLLVGLRRRYGLRGSLPTIHERRHGDPRTTAGEAGLREEREEEEEEEEREEEKEEEREEEEEERGRH